MNSTVSSGGAGTTGGSLNPPNPLKGRNLTARVLRQKVWKPANVDNDWCCFVFVGREGSGKSMTTASILEKADPSFTAERVHFEPQSFLDQVRGMRKEDRRGKAFMLDESGVGLGVRSWYDQDQIKMNQLMQTARDDNMIIGNTLPRLSELDSQYRGRLHGFCEMREITKGDHAVFSWKNVKPSRDERDKLYKMYPRMRFYGRKRVVKRLAIGPPSQQFIEEYEEHKKQFKEGLYEETSESMDGPEEERDPKDIAAEILDDNVTQYIKDNHGQKYIDRELLGLDYDLGNGKTKRVKAVLLNSEEVPDDVM